MDELDLDNHLDLSVRLYGGSELSKTELKMLSTNAKNAKNPILIFLWRMAISYAVCKHDWQNVRSYLFFNMQKFWTRCVFGLNELLLLLWELIKGAKIGKKVSEKILIQIHSQGWGIKGIVYSKCHHFITLKLFQTCMNFFLLWRMSKQTVYGPYGLP